MKRKTSKNPVTLPQQSLPQLSLWAGIILLLAALSLYLATLDNGLRPDELLGGDLITHQYAQVEARPSNAPGYPLYTLGGWLWFRLGRFLFSHWLNATQILSLYSTLWSVASLAVLYAILLRVTSNQWQLTALLTAFHGTTYFFWYYSVTTEQYSSAVFQTLLMVWLAFHWDDRPNRATLLAMAFLSGTMLANMVTTLFIMPPLLWFIFFRATDSQRAYWLKPAMLLTYLRQPKLVMHGLCLTALPLLSYGYIYLRGAQHPEWRGQGDWPTAWAWFVDFLTIQQGQDELGPGLSLDNFFTAEFPALMGTELTWVVLVGGLLGIATLGLRRAIFLYTTLLIYVMFCWAYRFGNWFQVIIPAYPLVVIGWGSGWAWLRQRINRSDGTSVEPAETKADQPPRRFAARLSQVSRFDAASYILLTGLLIVRLTTNVAAANQHNRAEAIGLQAGQAILADAPASEAIILADFSERVALQYLQTMEQHRPDVTVIPPNTDNPVPLKQTDRPLYLTRQAFAAAPHTVDWSSRHPQAAGDQLIWLSAAPIKQMPDTARPLDLAVGPHLKLMGYDSQYDAAASSFRLTIYWQTTAPLPVDYTMSARPQFMGQPLMTESGPLIQDHQPVWGAYPTSRWQPHEIVADGYSFTLPPNGQPDSVQLVIYHRVAEDFENLAVQTILLED